MNIPSLFSYKLLVILFSYNQGIMILNYASRAGDETPAPCMKPYRKVFSLVMAIRRTWKSDPEIYMTTFY